jgi:hypothetical protein
MFSNPVLLRGVGARHTMRDTSALKIVMQLVILTTPIRLDSLDLGIQETLDMGLEGVKHLFNIRLVFQKINPTKTRVVINKTYIILVSPKRGTRGAPNIRMN